MKSELNFTRTSKTLALRELYQKTFRPGNIILGPEMRYNNKIQSTIEERHMSLEELETEIKKLTLKERAALAKWLVETLDDLSEPEIEGLWTEEAERRLDELEEGLETEIPAEEVLRRARAATP
jgi:putative addiction module component (TIGR02574 family)